MENMRNTLLAQGIDAMLVDSMLKSLQPKKEKTRKAYFASTNPRPSTKEERAITVYTKCMCCGSVQQTVITTKVAKDSPDIQKTVQSVCKDCPDMLRQFTHEELVTMLLIGEKPQLELHHASIKFRASLAKQLTPETVVTFTSLSAMQKGE